MATVSMDKRMKAAIDRISELPEVIIHHILFFMPAKDAARTTILSKTWKSMWNSLPRYDVNFDQKKLKSFGSKILFLKRRKREKFMDYVDRSLMILHEKKVIIEQFRLDLTICDDSIFSRIDQWIELANKNHIKRLVLNFKVGYTSKYYTLTPSTFVSNSLVSLSLNHCKFTKSLFCDNTKFCCLRELKLEEVFVDDEIIQTLLSNFPLLEIFFLKYPSRVENLRIFNLPRLTEVEIYGVAKVEIEAPNLRILVFDIMFVYFNRMLPINLVVTPPNRLRNLTIRSYNSTAQSISNLISKLPFLEILELNIRLEGLKISSIRLQELRLFSLDTHHLGEFEIDTPNLHSLCIDINGQGILPSVFTINASSLLHVEITARCPLDTRINIYSIWLIRLRKYLTRFKKVDHLTLSMNAFYNTKSAFALEKFGNETIPLPNVKHLKLTIIPHTPRRNRFINYNENYTGLIDALLWNFRPDILSIPPHTPRRNRFMKLLYKKLVDQEKNQDCCKDNNIKCWRHYLKGFEYVSLDGINVQDLQCRDEVQFELKW